MKLFYKNIAPNQLEIELPSSKSISNRALIIQALCDEKIDLTNLSEAKDTQLMIRNLTAKSNEKHIGIAGSTARFLSAYYATKNKHTTLFADKRMQERPMKILCKALEDLGARFTYLNEAYHLPFQISGEKTTGGELSIDASVSSQFISALMLIAPKLKNGLIINLKGKVNSKPYLKMTQAVMAHFGATVNFNEDKISIKKQDYKANTLKIESDWSAAAFFYSALALLDEGSLLIKNLYNKSWQGDSEVAAIFYRLGIKTSIIGNRILLEKTNNRITRFDYDFSSCPDLAQAVICTCSGLGITGKFTGLSTLKHKETNRIQALQNELKKLRWDFNEIETGTYALSRSNTNTVFNDEIESYNDHRMAMAFAPLCIVHNSLTIRNPEVVEKSFPHFWKELAKLGIY